MRLKGRISLVTGASRGIGKAIALAFAKEGASVVLNCSQSVREAEEVAQEITGLGRRAMVVQAEAFLAYKGVQNPFVPVAFLTGGFFSGLCGFLGMKTATNALSGSRRGDRKSTRWRRGYSRRSAKPTPRRCN